jgi:flagellar biosynthesis component FlhA
LGRGKAIRALNYAKSISRKSFPPCVLGISVYRQSVNLMPPRWILISGISGSSKLVVRHLCISGQSTGCLLDRLLFLEYMAAAG